MNKKVLFIILGAGFLGLVLLIIIGVIAYNAFFNKFTSPSNSTTTPTVTSTIDSTNNTTETKACDILTLDLAKTILNDNSVTKQSQDQDEHTCTYTTPVDGSFNYQMLVFVLTESTVADSRTSYEAAKSLAYGSTGEKISVSGADDAYWAPGILQLSVLKGKYWFIVSGITNGEEKTVLKQAAEQIVSRL